MEDYSIIVMYVIFILGFIISLSLVPYKHECHYRPNNNSNIYVCTCGNVLEVKEE